jgi:hypothetical protein
LYQDKESNMFFGRAKNEQRNFGRAKTRHWSKNLRHCASAPLRLCAVAPFIYF